MSSFQELGCGTLQKLLSDSQKQPSKPPQPQTISYLSPLLLNSTFKESHNSAKKSSQKPPQTRGLSSVGVLGHQSKQDALSRLKEAPLLEDLAEWSHWELVFQPQFGKLSDFLLSPTVLNSESLISALEVSPGKLLKIDSSSSIQDFNAAVDAFNPFNVAGHLVSLIVQRENTKDISPQLLANQVTSFLERKKAEVEVDEKLSKFIFECLLRIPLNLCSLIATEVKIVFTISSMAHSYGLCSPSPPIFSRVVWGYGFLSSIDDFPLMSIWGGA